MPHGEPTEPAGESAGIAASDVPAAETPLGRAQVALQETAEQLKALTARRREVLLTGSDEEVAAVDAEIEAAQRVQRTRTDRVAVLLEHAAEEAAVARAAACEARIVETERLFVERDAAVADLKDHLVAAEAAFRKVYELGVAARAAWPWEHGRAGGTLTAAHDLVREVGAFLYKIGGRPALLGGQFPANVPPAFPGAKCPKIELLQLPDKLPDLVAQYRDASRFASDIMRGVRVDAAPPSPASPGEAGQSNVEPLPQVSPFKVAPDPELSRLLARQNALVSGPMDARADAEYELLSAQIRALSA